MRVSKRALRTLPGMLLLEMLTQVITLAFIGIGALIKATGSSAAADVTVLASGLVLLAIWMTGAVCLYGIMDLSKYFRYSWYLHIVYFVIKAVVLVLDGISAVMGEGISQETLNLFGAAADFLSSVRELSGIAAQCLVMLGFRTLLEKLGERDFGRKCRKYVHIFLIVGILFFLNNITGLVIQLLIPAPADQPAVEYLPVLVIYAILNIFTTAVSIPAFLTARKSCKTIYGTLRKAQVE